MTPDETKYMRALELVLGCVLDLQVALDDRNALWVPRIKALLDAAERAKQARKELPDD